MNGRRRAEQAAAVAILVAIASTPLLAAFAHRGYVVAILAAGVFAFVAVAFQNLRPTAFLQSRIAAAVAAPILLSLWLLVSCLWSDVSRPWKVWSDFTFTAGACVFVAVVAARQSGRALERMAAVFVAAAAVALLLLAFEGVTGGLLRAALPPAQPAGAVKDFVSLARGVTAALPAAFAAFIVLIVRGGRGAGPAAACLAVIAVLAATSYDITANGLALAAGALALAVALAAPGLMLRLSAAVMVLAALAAPLAAFLPVEALLANDHPALDPSWSQRLFIWREAGLRALDCAPFGCGADYARALSKLGETVIVPGWPAPLPVMPLHPHNVFLQIWMDLGAPGAILLAVLVWVAAGALAKSKVSGPVKAGAAALFAAGIVSLMIEASLWQAWRIAAFGFGATGLAIAESLTRRHLPGVADSANTSA